MNGKRQTATADKVVPDFLLKLLTEKRDKENFTLYIRVWSAYRVYAADRIDHLITMMFRRDRMHDGA